MVSLEIREARRVLVVGTALAMGCAGPGPSLRPFGAGQHDFAPDAVRESQDRARIHGVIYRSCGAVPSPADGVEVELLEAGARVATAWTRGGGRSSS